jgi:Glucose-6-phosphate dehydrogenase, C-terminal domain
LALQELMDTQWAGLRGQTSYSPERFTEAVYQEVVAGRPRLAGALAALEYFGVPGAERRAERCAAVKQEHLIKLIAREDSVEETWRIVQPLLDHPPDVRPYPRGSWGPQEAETLLRGHPRWQQPWLPETG